MQKLSIYFRVLLFSLLLVFAPACKFGFGSKAGNSPTALTASVCFEGLKQENVSLLKNDDGTLDIQLKWAEVSGASYNVYSDSKFDDVVAEVNKTEWSKKNVIAGETYVFGVRAINASCEDLNKRFVIFEIPIDRPKFSGLRKAATVSNTKLWLKWDKASSENIRGYNIYYSRDLKNPVGFATETNSVFTGLSESTEYCFVVRAQDKWGIEDTNKISKCATTLSEAVPNFAGLSYVEQLAGRNGLTKLRLVWEKAGGSVTGYQIFMSTKSEGQDFKKPEAALLSVTGSNIPGSYIAGASTTSAVVDGLTKDTNYYFVVRAFYLDGSEFKTEFSYVEKSQKTLASIPPPVAPEITSILPKAGSSSGNTNVTIVGKNFQDLAVVKIGGLVCSNANTVSSTKLTCVTGGPHADAFVDVEITNPDEGYGKKERAYEYTSRPSPNVNSIVKNSGPFSGGTIVTISGANFVSKPTVLIGDKECTQVVFVNAGEIKCTTPSNSPGSYDVLVINPDGQIGSLANGYSYSEAPKILSITPSSGPKSGGTSVTILGTGFALGIKIFFGANECINPSVNSTTLICQSPSATNDGAVNVQVKNLDDQSDTKIAGFSYVPRPIITSILPASGNTLGGTEVTIKGGGFIIPPIVFIGGAQCRDVDRKDSATIVCKTPPRATPGTVSISVQNPDGQTSEALVNAYTYRDAPTITQVSPTAGPTTGTTPVTVIGTGFMTGATVTFGSANCGSPIYLPTIITCTLANKPEGKVDVVVQNPDMQTGTKLKAYYFTDQVAPTVTGISHNIGSYLGGNNVTITGTEFVDPVTVSLGGSDCTNPVVVNPNTITCTTTAHDAGLVNVTVTNNDLQPATKNGAFTYVENSIPTITLINPNVGPVNGFTAVQIEGTGFVNSPTLQIKFGNNLCTSLNYFSDILITCTTPAGALGSVNVYFTNGDGQVLMVPNGFTYQNGPTVSSVVPNKGPVGGGQPVKVKGTNFLGGTSVTVKFGGSNCINPFVDSDTQISCTTPAGSLANPSVIVKVTSNPSGQTGQLANAYTYRDGPKVIGVFPAYGAIPNQSYSIAILGSNIDGTATVQVAGLPCTNTQIPFPYNKITCDTPALPEGDAEIVIKNADNQMLTLSKGFHVGLPSYKQPTAGTALLSGAMDARGRKDGFNHAARFYGPFDIVGDTTYLYVTDAGNHTIRKVHKSSGEVSVLAGTAGVSGCLSNAAGGTPFANLKLTAPRGAIMIGTDLYVALWQCHQIIKLDLSSNQMTGGKATLVANVNWPAGLATDNTNLYFTSMYGLNLYEKPLSSNDVNAYTRIAGDGTLLTANSLPYPDSIAYYDNAIYLSMYHQNSIRKFDLVTRTLSTVIGGQGSGKAGCIDGIGTNALLQNPLGIYIKDNFMYLGTAGSGEIRRVDLNNMQVSQYVGSCTTSGRQDGTVGGISSPTVGNIRGFYKENDTIYFTDTSNNVVRKIVDNGSSIVVTTPYGIESTSDNAIDGQGIDARFSHIGGNIVLLGDYYYAPDWSHHLIRKIHKVTGATTTFSGTKDVAGNKNGTVVEATYYHPVGIATDGVHLYVSEHSSALIRKIDMRANTTSNFAGGTANGYLDHADGSKALFQNPHDMVSDGAYLYMADRYNHTIRKINLATRAVSTLAGIGRTSCVTLSCDGPASSALFKDPTGVTTDGTYVYVGEMSHVIRRVNISNGQVDTIAGGFNQAAYLNGNSTTARFYYPVALTTDGVSLFAVDQWNHLLREVNLETNDVSTLLGEHNAFYDEDGPLASARIIRPRFITIIEGIILYGTGAIHVLR